MAKFKAACAEKINEYCNKDSGKAQRCCGLTAKNFVYVYLYLQKHLDITYIDSPSNNIQTKSTLN